ncbi:MAG: hypothetical protein H6812_02310 [Phycisphaeraceae bacterium]|nr:hypothetical protein [Phycisphaerales bacterium]MCB9842071.1 hypothetical protein [Phycisphaeraceae bacterium]
MVVRTRSESVSTPVNIPLRHAVYSPEGHRRQSMIAAVFAGVVFFLALMPIVVTDYDGSAPTASEYKTRAGFDHGGYHLPVIRAFEAQLPTPDLSDYASATTPGYHLMMAVVARVVSDDARVLRGMSALIGAVFVGVMVYALAVGGVMRGARYGVTRAMPLAFSVYVVSSAGWLLPDNAAWLLVLVIMMIALMARLRICALVGAGAALVGLVLVRQVHIWAAAPIWFAWWLGERDVSDAARAAWIPSREDPLSRKAMRTGVAVLATLPAIGLIAWFVMVWDGMTPPSFSTRLSGPNFVVPATVLSVLAIFGAFFVGDWLPAAWAALRERTGARVALMVSAVIGLVVGVVPESSYRFEDRISHIWIVVKRLPTVGERSPVIVLGSIAGAVMAGMIFNALGRRDRWVMLSVLGAFVASQTSGALAWPRYYEPLVLVWVALACARIESLVPDRNEFAPVRWAHAVRTPLVVVLAVLQLGVTVVSLR